jgi:hypothetical protein
VLRGAFSRLEPCAVKVARTVLRGRGGGNVTLLPDVRHEVARVFIKEAKDPVFCHRYPTGPCVGGNPGVRSVRDTVASA